MPIRDIVLTLVVLGSLPYIWRRPYIGVLMWSWLSYMNPHRLAFGFAYSMPFAQIVAITLLMAMLFSKEAKKLPASGTVFIWLLFIFWMGVTTIFAIFPESASTQFVKIIKIQLIAFITMMLMTNQERLNQLIWVIVLSLGFFSVKGGIFTLLSGGGFRVYGPPGTYIQENNSLALATLLVIPLMVYLAQLHRDTWWVRLGLIAASILSLVSVLGSQSRGALVAILAFAVFFWMKSRSKFMIGLGLLILAVSLYSFMPASWHERMSSIQNYQEDGSAMGRINAWNYAINVASDRITGAGLESWKSASFAIWAPNPNSVHAAHSIYFSVLADHGWFGLFLFLLIFFLAWRNLSKVIVACSNPGNVNGDVATLARMMQVSFVAYASGGAFLSLSYFDLPWHLVAISILLKHQYVSKKSPMHNFGSKASGGQAN